MEGENNPDKAASLGPGSKAPAGSEAEKGITWFQLLATRKVGQGKDNQVFLIITHLFSHPNIVNESTN